MNVVDNTTSVDRDSVATEGPRCGGLVFIGMLQDAGLSLEDIGGILGAEHVEDWKAIGRRRLVELDAEIERLQRARGGPSTAHSCAVTTIRQPTARSWARKIHRRLDATVK